MVTNSRGVCEGEGMGGHSDVEFFALALVNVRISFNTHRGISRESRGSLARIVNHGYSGHFVDFLGERRKQKGQSVSLR